MQEYVFKSKIKGSEVAGGIFILIVLTAITGCVGYMAFGLAYSKYLYGNLVDKMTFLGMMTGFAAFTGCLVFWVKAVKDFISALFDSKRKVPQSIMSDDCYIRSAKFGEDAVTLVVSMCNTDRKPIGLSSNFTCKYSDISYAVSGNGLVYFEYQAGDSKNRATLVEEYYKGLKVSEVCDLLKDKGVEVKSLLDIKDETFETPSAEA